MRFTSFWSAPSGSWKAMVIGVLVYAALNLLGTALLLREVRDHETDRRRNVDRWQFLIKVAFVLQLPVGIGVLLIELL